MLVKEHRPFGIACSIALDSRPLGPADPVQTVNVVVGRLVIVALEWKPIVSNYFGKCFVLVLLVTKHRLDVFDYIETGVTNLF